MYSNNLTLTRKKFCLSSHYDVANSYLFANGTEIIEFIAKGSEIVATPLCLRNTWKDWSVDNMMRTGFEGYVYDFCVDYNGIEVDDILDIHEYLMSLRWKFEFVFEFIKKTGLTILSIVTLLAVTPLRCISMTNQECQCQECRCQEQMKWGT